MTETPERLPNKPLTRRAIKKQLSESRQDALIDHKTGLLNDRGFRMRLQQEINRAARNHTKIAILYFDANGLGMVNNNLGHEIGDIFIEKIAETLQGSFRPTDLLARMGEQADEFVVAMPVKNRKQVKEAYARVNEHLTNLRSDWQEYAPVLPGGTTELDFNDINGSLRIAEKAMYEAKSRSKDQGMNILIFGKTPIAA